MCVTLSAEQDASRSNFEHVFIACPHATRMRASAKVSEAFAILGLEEVRSFNFLLFSDILHTEIGIFH